MLLLSIRVRANNTTISTQQTHQRSSQMDKNKIGTDATIASHIKTIQDREYVVKEGQHFKPTKLGIALVEGYNSMGYQLNKPHLRAKMERQCNQIAR